MRWIGRPLPDGPDFHYDPSDNARTLKPMAMLAYSAAQDDSPPQALRQPKPVIWVLHGPRIGDNAQADALASRLGGHLVRKFLDFNLFHGLPNLVLRASRLSLKAHSRKQLTPPWPELVVGIGKRSASIARWIKCQSKDKTVIVQLGRARAPFGAFDLLITTPQYGLPPAPNVIEMPLPFAARRRVGIVELHSWRAEWSGLRRPLIAAVVGNAKYPVKFGEREAQLLGQQLNALAEHARGSLLLIASPRSVPRLVTQIESAMCVPHMTYRTFDVARNPYHAALAICDYFVATSDTISTISELIETGKPVDVFELPNRRIRVKWRARSGLCAWLSRSGVLQPPRDVSRMVRTLIQNGYVNVLGEQTERIPFKRADAVILERLDVLIDARHEDRVRPES